MLDRRRIEIILTGVNMLYSTKIILENAWRIQESKNEFQLLRLKAH